MSSTTLLTDDFFSLSQFFPQYMNDAELGAIIEGALHQCVLEPLNSGIGMSWFKEYKE